MELTDLIEPAYFALLAIVILGHFGFVFAQWFRWPRVCKRLTDFTDKEIEKTRFLGRSFASYNAAIGIGLLLSMRLENDSAQSVQIVTLALIAATAAVGNSGARGNLIFYSRFLPATFAFLLLIAKIVNG